MIFMTLFKNKYRIESTRLPGWDYSNSGYYFVTICTRKKEPLLGKIVDGILSETPQSKITLECWENLSSHYCNCVTDEFIIMPNHVHGIIIIDNSRVHHDDCNEDANNNWSSADKFPVETGFKPVSEMSVSVTKPVDTLQTFPANSSDITNNSCTKKISLSEIIRGFKTFSARKINKSQNSAGLPFWQPGFYDHIIRDVLSLEEIRKYIQNNPLMWDRDKYNTASL